MSAPIPESGPAAGGPQPFPAEELKQTVEHFAKDANSALNGVADAVGLTEKVARQPYGMVLAALGLGYVVGGGLFTPTTMRLVRLGMKLASVPPIRDRLLDLAESAVDSVVQNAQSSNDGGVE